MPGLNRGQGQKSEVKVEVSEHVIVMMYDKVSVGGRYGMIWWNLVFYNLPNVTHESCWSSNKQY